MTKLYKLRQLKKSLEAMTVGIAGEEKGSQTRNELRNHLDWIDKLDKEIEEEEAKLEL